MTMFKCPSCKKRNAGTPAADGFSIYNDRYGDHATVYAELDIACANCFEVMASLQDYDIEFNYVDVEHGMHTCKCGLEHPCPGVMPDTDIGYSWEIEQTVLHEEYVRVNKHDCVKLDVHVSRTCPHCNARGTSTETVNISLDDFEAKV